MTLRWLSLPAVLGGTLLMGATLSQQAPPPDAQVRERERAFAQTMAQRDHDAFTFLGDPRIRAQCRIPHRPRAHHPDPRPHR